MVGPPQRLQTRVRRDTQRCTQLVEQAVNGHEKELPRPPREHRERPRVDLSREPEDDPSLRGGDDPLHGARCSRREDVTPPDERADGDEEDRAKKPDREVGDEAGEEQRSGDRENVRDPELGEALGGEQQCPAEVGR